MSGSLSSSDIEDVVSSVRRLVSVDARPRPVSRDLGADRLLLTPSLRIVPETGSARGAEVPLVLAVPGPVPEAAAPLADAVAISSDQADDPVVTGVLAEPPVADDPTEPSAVPDAALAPAVAPESAPEKAAPVVAAAAAGFLQLVDSEWEDEIWADNETPLSELALGVEEAELVPAEALREPEPSVSDAEMDDPDASAALLPPEGEQDQPWGAAEGDWAGEQADPVVPFDGRRQRGASADEADPLRGAPVELTDTDGNPLTILDELALQEMVRQLIREELQGGLGERITRNVRKLVRAEINRALTARALD